jgi:RES domain-containing protein
MNLWRLCRQAHADLDGEGARRFGGRWNRPGYPVVYLAEHPALAALEVRVHLDLPFALLPADYVLMQVVIPDGLIADVTVPPVDTVAIGTAFLSDPAAAAALKVPSVLVPHAWNVLLNPRHPGAGLARIDRIEPFRFDARLWYP